jgi:hypothetical protein
LEFIDRIAIARTKFAAQIQTMGKSVEPKFPKTDILGFLMLASQLFQEAGQHQLILIVLSDMRQSSPPLDIEQVRVVPVATALSIVKERQLLADLSGVQIFTYGAHSVGKDVVYWRSLKTFWTAYFARCHADLRAFSITRELPKLDQGK